jgi:hypothetical protein
VFGKMKRRAVVVPIRIVAGNPHVPILCGRQVGGM